MRNSKGQFLKGIKYQLGYRHTQASRKKIRDARKRQGSNVGMRGKHHTAEAKRKNSESHKKNPTNYWLGKKRIHMSGANNWNWKGGVTPENERIRHSVEYMAWRKEVWKRDSWTCRDCGIKCSKRNIVAHHLKLFSDFPELRFAVDNGITLCRSCHTRLHKTYVMGIGTATNGTITIKDGIITAVQECTNT